MRHLRALDHSGFPQIYTCLLPLGDLRYFLFDQSPFRRALSDHKY